MFHNHTAPFISELDQLGIREYFGSPPGTFDCHRTMFRAVIDRYYDTPLTRTRILAGWAGTLGLPKRLTPRQEELDVYGHLRVEVMWT